MNITRFEPWSFFDVLQRDIDRVAGRHVPAMGQRDNGDIKRCEMRSLCNEYHPIRTVEFLRCPAAGH